MAPFYNCKRRENPVGKKPSLHRVVASEPVITSNKSSTGQGPARPRYLHEQGPKPPQNICLSLLAKKQKWDLLPGSSNETQPKPSRGAAPAISVYHGGLAKGGNSKKERPQEY